MDGFIETIAAGFPLFDQAEIAKVSQDIILRRSMLPSDGLVDLADVDAVTVAENRLALMLLHNRLLLKGVV